MNAHMEETSSRFTPDLDALRMAGQQELTMARDELARRRRTAEAYVYQKPWKSLGMALGVGVVLGWMIRRR